MTRDNYIKRWIIPALERTWNDSKCKEIIEFLEQKTCEDCISRQAVIDEIYESRNNFNNEFGQGFFADKIKALPPVNPHQKTGHWIDADGDNAICGCCNRLNHLYGTYCKHCGARMVEEQKERDK